jgi:hypothetical protein
MVTTCSCLSAEQSVESMSATKPRGVDAVSRRTSRQTRVREQCRRAPIEDNPLHNFDDAGARAATVINAIIANKKQMPKAALGGHEGLIETGGPIFSPRRNTLREPRRFGRARPAYQIAAPDRHRPGSRDPQK